MKKEELFEALGEVRIENFAKTEPKKPKIRRFKYMAVIAALVAAIALPTVIYAEENRRYNAAVGYLQSLGIDAEDLSNYTRADIIWAVKAGNQTIVYNMLPDNVYAPNTNTPEEAKVVTAEQVKKLTPTMTREEVIAELGETVDVGSGMYIYVYNVEGQGHLTLLFTAQDSQLGVEGERLLRMLKGSR